MDLKNKNVVFVGFGGIGFESCKCLMSKNLANLMILDVTECPDKLKAIQLLNKTTNVKFIKCDITNKTSIKNAFDQIVKAIKYIDVLVNGAGILKERNVELTINVNLIGLINTTLEALPYMDKAAKGRGGVILNISSVAGLEPMGSTCIYSASKFGVIGFTRSLADPVYYERTGVTILGLCPGLTHTPLTANSNLSETFDYSLPMAPQMRAMPPQSASKAGELLVEIIENEENGTIWIAENSARTKVDFKPYWTY
ncbi:alcohol dehydrogenase 2-like [Haematobia irritans]|uniref:alcohol dehydrogenase 2-like n=1 Tax=Haematobia irritans TaxID=7368 RepID=UPI003F4FCAA8